MSKTALLDEVIERGDVRATVHGTECAESKILQASNAAKDEESDSEWTSCSSDTDEYDDADSDVESGSVRAAIVDGIDDTGLNSGGKELDGAIMELNGGWPMHGAEAKRRDNPKYTGTGGRLDFFAMYRDDVHLRNCGLESPRSLHLRKAAELKQMPLTKAIIREGSEIDLNGRSIGGTSAAVVAAGLGHILDDPSVQKLNLRDNRLDAGSAQLLFASLLRHCREGGTNYVATLDLSCNPLGSGRQRQAQPSYLTCPNELGDTAARSVSAAGMAAEETEDGEAVHKLDAQRAMVASQARRRERQEQFESTVVGQESAALEMSARFSSFAWHQHAVGLAASSAELPAVGDDDTPLPELPTDESDPNYNWSAYQRRLRHGREQQALADARKFLHSPQRNRPFTAPAQQKALWQQEGGRQKPHVVGKPKLMLSSLADLLHQGLAHLTNLSLEQTQLADSGVWALREALVGSRTLRKLNLAHNGIGAGGSLVGAEALMKLLEENGHLTALSLAWNELAGEAAVKVASGLCANISLQVLDLAWNSFGRESSTPFAISRHGAAERVRKPHTDSGDGDGNDDLDARTTQAREFNGAAKLLALALADKKKSLRHVDFSYNRLGLSACSILAEGIRRNRKLVGLHVDGNDCILNAHGEIVPCRQTTNANVDNTFHARILDYGEASQRARRPACHAGMCWLCDRWKEHTFEFLVPAHMDGKPIVVPKGARFKFVTPPRPPGHGMRRQSNVAVGSSVLDVAASALESLEERDHPVPAILHNLMIHLSIDNFRGTVMQRLPKKGVDENGGWRFVLPRMLPPGVCRFFFSTRLPRPGGSGPDDVDEKRSMLVFVSEGIAPNASFPKIDDGDSEVHYGVVRGSRAVDISRVVEQRGPRNERQWLAIARHFTGKSSALKWPTALKKGSEDKQCSSSDDDGDWHEIMDVDTLYTVPLDRNNVLPVQRMPEQLPNIPRALAGTDEIAEGKNLPVTEEADSTVASPLVHSQTGIFGDSSVRKVPLRPESSMRQRWENALAARAAGGAASGSSAAALERSTQGSTEKDAERGTEQNAQRQEAKTKRRKEKQLARLRRDRVALETGAKERRLPKLMNSLAVPPASWFECEHALPRLQRGETLDSKQDWRLENSVFGARARQCDAATFWDDDEVLLKAFEADWRRTKAKRIVSDPEDFIATHKEMRQLYPAVLASFSKYCSLSLHDPFSLGTNAYRQMLIDWDIPEEDNPDCNVGGLDLCFVETNVEVGKAAKGVDNPDKALTRFEWLEIMVRIAKAKFVKSKKCATVAEAVQRLFVEHALPALRKDGLLATGSDGRAGGARRDHYELHHGLLRDAWRNDRLYKESVHLAFKAHLKPLRKMFKHYCNIFEKNNSAMGCNEFVQLLNDKRLVDAVLPKRSAVIAFILGKMVYIDPLLRHKCSPFKLTFVDFLESLARVADLRARGSNVYGPWNYRHPNIDEGEPKPLAELVKQLLEHKLFRSYKRIMRQVSTRFGAVKAFENAPKRLAALLASHSR